MEDDYTSHNQTEPQEIGQLTFFRYVRVSEIDDFERHGWSLVCTLQGHHGAWSVLMEYIGGGIGP